MRIDRIELDRVDLPIAVGAGAHRTRTRSLLALRAFAGAVVGRGEAAPLPRYSLDTIEACEEALRSIPLPLVTEDLRSIERAAAPLPPAARMALECALLDLAGQASGRPLWSLLRAHAAPTLQLCHALVSAPGEAVADEARRAVEAGATTLKRKVDPHALDAELAVLARVRRDHPDVALRVDANRGLSPTALAGAAPALRALALDLLEEPCDGPDDVAADHALPLALDESLAAWTSSSALAALAPRLPHARAIVVKPMRDGLLGALALADAARAAGARVVVTHTWDGPIGHLAAVHVAFAIGDAVEAHGLGPQPVSARGPGAAPLRAILHDATCVRPDGPGLGA